MSERDYYEILGVSRESDAAELKSAYRKLALSTTRTATRTTRTRPRSSRRPRRPTPCSSDTEKRARYDRFGRAASSPGAGAGGFAGFDAAGFGDLSDLFGGIFGFASGGGFGGGPPRPMAGSDLVYRMEIAFRDAAFGVEAPIAISRLERCETCSGSGAAPGSKREDLSGVRRPGAAAGLAGISHRHAPVPAVPGRRQDHRQAVRRLPRRGPPARKEGHDDPHTGRRRVRFPPAAARAKATPGPTAAPPATSTSS